MPDRPTISVVMPVYNGEKYVGRAIESILRQTFLDFEFLIVDDGSTDATPTLLGEYAARDARIRLLAQPHNTGVAAAGSRGCRETRGRYIARMDADDVSVPSRFAKQVAYLDAHSDVGILGGNIREFDERGARAEIWRRPTEPNVIAWFLLFGNCIAHPTVMMRRDVFERFGPYRDCACEDYDFWLRAHSETKMANLPDVLVHYCIREDQASKLFPARSTDLDLQRAMMSDLVGREVTRSSVELLRLEGIGAAKPFEINAAAKSLADLRQAFFRKFRPNHGDKAEIAVDVLKRLRSLGQPRGFRSLRLLIEASFSTRHVKRIADRARSA
jgi:glycosyltransferase involved in cell wall biosynthesis